MDIDRIHGYMYLLLGKEQGVYYSHAEIDDFLHRAQMARFTLLTGNVNDYAKGYPAATIDATITSDVMMQLSPFLVSDELMNCTLLSEGTSEAKMPGMVKLLSLISPMGPVKVYHRDEIPFELKSQIIKRDEDFPCAMMVAEGVRLYYNPTVPQAVPTMTATYLRTPARPKYAYTMSDGEPVFDPENSVNMEWDERNLNVIISNALAEMGISMGSQFDYQAGKAGFKDGV